MIGECLIFSLADLKRELPAMLKDHQARHG
jgi:hypothetical protein